MSFSAFVSGIDPNVDEANMTRFYNIELQSGLENRATPSDSIKAKFPIEELKALKRDITLDAIYDVPKLLQSYNEVRKAITDDPTILGANTLQRFKDNMCVLGSIVHAAGLDWKTWAHNTYKAKEESLKQLRKRTANDLLMDTIFHTSNVDTGQVGEPRKKVADFFETAHLDTELAMLNRSGCGVYFHKYHVNGRWYALIIWQEAIGGVLRGTSFLKVTGNTHALAGVAARYNLTVRTEEALDIIAKIKTIPAWVSRTPFTLVDINNFIMAEVEKNEYILNNFEAREEVLEDQLTQKYV